MSLKLAKLKAASQGVKVDHPLAKYNSRGDLYCLLCNILIKNANVWKVHLSNKTHKQNLILFKAGKKPEESNPSASSKRKKEVPPAPPRSLKKQKLTESLEEIPPVIPIAAEPAQKTGILKASSKVTPKLPEGFVPKSRLQKSDAPPDVGKIREVESKSNLPNGFFDDNVSVIDVPVIDADVEMEDDNKEEPESTSLSDKNLPEGFFDDARQDAKARKVEYKDPQDLEWARFQTEMEQEDIRYNSILEEDDQQLRDNRDADIGIEQKLWAYRVESITSSAQTGEIGVNDIKIFEAKLEIKQEVKVDDMDVKMEPESESESDEDILDWRVKRGL